MDVKDSISVTLKTIDGKETKDQSAKNIFSYKPSMSNILKYTVEEYMTAIEFWSTHALFKGSE